MLPVAVALSQSAFASPLRFLGEPCMGAVYQIQDLDSTSQSQPNKPPFPKVLPVGETSRSDRGGAASGEEGGAKHRRVADCHYAPILIIRQTCGNAGTESSGVYRV